MFRLVGALSTRLYVSEGLRRKQVCLRQRRTMMTHLILYTFSLLINPSFLGPYLLLSHIKLLNPTFLSICTGLNTPRSQCIRVQNGFNQFLLCSILCVYTWCKQACLFMYTCIYSCVHMYTHSCRRKKMSHCVMFSCSLPHCFETGSLTDTGSHQTLISRTPFISLQSWGYRYAQLHVNILFLT